MNITFESTGALLFSCYSTWLWSAFLRCTVLCSAVMHYALLNCILFYSNLFQSSLLYSTPLNSTPLQSTALNCHVIYWTLLSSLLLSPLLSSHLHMMLSNKKNPLIACIPKNQLTWHILSLPPDTVNAPDPDCPTTDLTDWGRRLCGSWRRTLFAKTLNSTDSLVKSKCFIFHFIWSNHTLIGVRFQGNYYGDGNMREWN